MTDWRAAVAPYLVPPLRAALAGLRPEEAAAARELRLRAERPALIRCKSLVALDAPKTTAADVGRMAEAMLGHAAHARQEELRQGFVTLAGGCRAGFCGRAVVREGKLASLQDIAFLSIRIAREVRGAAEGALPWLLEGERPRNALIVSPPGLGKTTLLRDAARLLSGRGLAVALVDERSELAACVQGVPTLDVGANTDVLDGSPKAEGIQLMLRAMTPEVVVTDELGRPEDATAVLDAARCGVAVLASAHGRNYADAEARPVLGALLRERVFERVLALDGLGHVGAVYNGRGERLA